MGEPAPPLESMEAIEWSYYNALLAGTEPPKMHPWFAPWGYYRKDDVRKGTSVAVSILPDAQKRRWVRIGDGKAFRLKTPEEEGKFCYDELSYFSRKVVSYEAYIFWMEHKRWPPEKVADAIEASAAPADHNGPPETIAWEALNELAVQAREWHQSLGEAGITTQADADKAGDFASRFAEMEADANRLREEGRKPHLEAADAVQKVWKPIVDNAADVKRWVKGLVAAFIKAENARKLKEAAEAAERGEAVKMGDLKGAKAGTRGRAISARTRAEYRCDDYAAVFAHYRDDPRFRDSPAVASILGKMAKDDLEDGKTVPGARLETVQTVA